METQIEKKDLNKRIQAGFVLNSAFAIIEFVAGLWSGSLALVSDSIHNMTDSLSLLVAFTARKLGDREATSEHTYGYGKANILAALTNSTILIGVAIFIFYEAVKHILHPQAVEGGVIIIVTLIGIIINSTIALLLKKYKEDLNVKSVYLNMLFDVIALVGAFIAGFAILITHKTIIDPIVSILISLMLAYTGFKITNDAIHILLEGVPEGLDVKKVEATILNTPNITTLDNLHIWTISADSTALSCHIVVSDYNLENNIKTIEKLKNELQEKFGINHTTIEIGLTPTPPHKH